MYKEVAAKPTTRIEACSGCELTNDCIETGTRIRSDDVCRAGQIEAVNVSAQCTRETDGQVLVEGQFDACIYDTQCSTRGQRSRHDTVCSDGVENLRVVTTFDGCERAAVPGWAECDGCVDVRIQREHCGACGIVCPQNAVCDAGECRCSGGWEGPECNLCPPNFAGDTCDRCADNFAGAQCEACQPGFQGADCSEESALDYQDYVRQPGVAFTPA